MASSSTAKDGGSPSPPPATTTTPTTPTTPTKPAGTSQVRSADASPAPRKSALRKNASIKSLVQSASSATSNSGRIDSILEGARERKIAMDRDSESESRAGPASGTERGNVSPGAKKPFGSERRAVSREYRDTESSADEATAIIRGARGSRRGPDYQGANQQQGDEARRRNGASSAGRRSAEAEGERSEEDVAGEHQGWWAKVLSEYGSLELENKGSVARDHLALERTFLAWLRTSLAFASIGIAITQLFRLNTASSDSSGSDRYRRLRQMGKPLGATFLGISIVMLFIGFHRYFESQHWIIRGKFPASRGSVMLVVALTFALMITSLVVVIVTEPGSFEK